MWILFKTWWRSILGKV